MSGPPRPFVVIGVAYVVTLAVGFASAGFSRPIVDPVLAVMEILTLLSAPHSCRPDGRGARVGYHPTSRIHGVFAVAFVVLLAGLTSSVHFVELTAVRQSSTARLIWPSTAYALELLDVGPVLGPFAALRGTGFQGRQTGGCGIELASTSAGTLSVFLASSARRAETCVCSSSPSWAMRGFSQR